MSEILKCNLCGELLESYMKAVHGEGICVNRKPLGATLQPPPKEPLTVQPEGIDYRKESKWKISETFLSYICCKSVGCGTPNKFKHERLVPKFIPCFSDGVGLTNLPQRALRFSHTFQVCPCLKDAGFSFIENKIFPEVRVSRSNG